MPKAKPITMPAPETPELIGSLKDAFLFTGDFQWMFYVTLVGFCLANASPS